MTKETETLRQWISEARNIVFFGGAGVSTASGIPDFRSAHQGIYNTPGGRSYEEMLSHEYFVTHPDEFWDFYRRVMLYPEAKPNAAHLALAELERRGKCKAVITQNIDGLHQAAGSQKVLELHGSVHRNRCIKCGHFYPLEPLLLGEGAPRCQCETVHGPCGGIVKPEVVLYGEPLDDAVMEEALEAIARCDLLIVAGTSLVVYPAAGLIRYRSPRCRLALLNRDATDYDRSAGLVVREDLTQVLREAVQASNDAAADSGR